MIIEKKAISQKNKKDKIPHMAEGKVISNKMNKTIVISTERKIRHPLYGKFIKKSTKLYAHDPNNSCCMGDIVTVKQIRPVSKYKTWILINIKIKSK